jgi:hypothetical protein
VGALLAVVACHALVRTSRRALVAIGAVGAMALSVGLWLRGSSEGLSEFLAIRPLGFLRFWDPLFSSLSIIFAYALATAVVLPGLRQRWARDPSRPGWRRWLGGGVALSWEELVLVMATAVIVPVLLLSGFIGWYFVDVLLWLALAVVLARLSRDDTTQILRSVASSKGGPAMVGFAVLLSAAALLRAFTPGELLGATTEMLSGLAREEGRPAPTADGASFRRLFAPSLVQHHVLFGPGFVAALRESYGVRMVQLIRGVTAQEGRSGLGVFVPAQNTKFWRYSVDCRSQPLFVPALAGVPMLRGLPPVVERCRLPRTFGYADYGMSSHSDDGDPGDLCRHALSRGLRRVLVLRDVDAPGANTVLRCAP